MLYRTNAQSRAIEDALMREGVPYRIIGGVRFYERKEIKDALAYLRLLINPHDDVSFRRVVNVPARGIGKSVLDALEAVEPGPDHDRRDTPLLAAGLESDAVAAIALGAAASSRSTGAPCRRGRSTPLKIFRDLIVVTGGRRRGRERLDHTQRACSIAPATCRICATSAARRPKRASRT